MIAKLRHNGRPLGRQSRAKQSEPSKRVDKRDLDLDLDPEAATASAWSAQASPVGGVLWAGGAMSSRDLSLVGLFSRPAACTRHILKAPLFLQMLLQQANCPIISYSWLATNKPPIHERAHSTERLDQRASGPSGSGAQRATVYFVRAKINTPPSERAELSLSPSLSPRVSARRP